MNFEFLDRQGTFRLENPEETSYLYFPLANEQGMKSSITPLLGGDAKGDQNTFLLQPVSSEDLHNNRSGRNFWCRFEDGKAWSAAGASAEQEAERFSSDKEETSLEAGMMWQKIVRTSKKYGLQSEIISFVPHKAGYLEVMMVTIRNTGEKECSFTLVAAVPLYARSADNIRDHRHVTSLLHRIHVRKEGVFVNPTLTFDERGHQQNQRVYGVAGFTGDGTEPVEFYPVVEDFIGEGGSFLMPKAVYGRAEGVKPQETEEYLDEYCGYEAMGAFSFAPCTLQAGEENTYIVLLGMSHSEQALRDEMREYHTRVQACKSLELLKEYWNTQNNVEYATGNRDFDQWMYWVDFQPMLRRIYGCSFLPHHDYGKGGRGWRDLWQDCLALLVMNPGGVRQMLIDNFAGVRYDGSNATIIGEKQGEFIADRNHITRVWMDHGVWPYLTTELYIRQTGDVKLLEEKVPFFKDAQIYRGEQYDDEWTEEQGCWLLTKQGVRYEASILEHLLVQHLTSFYDVGEHGEIRLRGADWNDAIDMASKRGESVAFTAAYAGNLWNLAELLIAYEKRTGQQECSILKELFLLLPEDTTIYDDIQGKKTLLKEFFATTAHQVSGEKETISIDALAEKLRTMSAFMKENIRKNEWVGNEDGMHWYNGYYDDNGRKVEGVVENNVRMMLTSQVFTIMSGTATDEQVKEIIASADKYLYDAKVGGYRLNTNFHEIKMDMGRMFGFAYGHKENGAVFSHMAVMYAHALYQRGFVKEGYRVIKTLFSHSMDFETSRIYPGIPEYFNDRGRGMYHYLTGAASWLMTTVLTESFGIKGYYGDLCLEPKLMAEQFDSKGTATVCCRFQGKNIEVCYHNPEGKEYGSYCIQKVTLNGDSVRETDGKKKTILIENTRLKTIENQIEVYLA